MPLPPRCPHLLTALLLLSVLSGAACRSFAQEAPNPGTEGPMVQPPDTHSAAQVQEPAPPPAKASPAAAPSAPPPPPAAHFDPALFLKPIPPAELAPLAQYDGAQAKDLFHEKLFRHTLKEIMPDCVFHYGRDMSLSEAVETVFSGSRLAVRVRDGRFLTASGESGPYLNGKGFVWIDLKQGIGLGVFYFTPTNGEPTPALNVFARQVREEPISLGLLPPEFAEDLSQWSLVSGIPQITTRYFLTGANRKILLEHDENFCLAQDGSALPPESGCEQEMADAADLDLTAAYYVDQTRNRTNATAWMLNPEQVEFISVRDNTCRSNIDPLGCRIVLTRQRTRAIIRRR